MNTINQNNTRPWIFKTLLVVVALLAIVGILVLLNSKDDVSNFEQCREAGGTILETYPEQCHINDESFTNEAQAEDNGDGYIGLNEEEAFNKAGEENTPARVVERDGESLPVTMDLVFGRHNFYVRDGEVYKVEIEGKSAEEE